MKKIFILLFLSLFLFSCSKTVVENNNYEEIETNQEVIENQDFVENQDVQNIVELDNLEEKASEEESSCLSVGKSYIDNNISNTEVFLNHSNVLELTNDECVVAYKYMIEGRNYWKVYNISTGIELYQTECLPSYDVENDIMTDCTQEEIDKNESEFKSYLDLELGKFIK